MNKTMKHYRISQEAQDLLDKLKSRLGQTETAVIELAIRRLAEEEAGKDKTMTTTFSKTYPEIEGFRGYKMGNGVMTFFYRGYQEPGIVGFDHDPIFDYIGHHIPRILEDTATGKFLSEREGLDQYGQPKEGVSEWPRKDPLFDMASDTEIELAGHHIKKTSWSRGGTYYENFYVTKA
jgi:hypothetical protein